MFVLVFFFLLPLCIAGAAGQNKQHFITKNTAKLDRETEELHHDRVPLEVGKVIQQGRQSKGMTQKDLATVSIARRSRSPRAGLGPARRRGTLPCPPVGRLGGLGITSGNWVSAASPISDLRAMLAMWGTVWGFVCAAPERLPGDGALLRLVSW